MTERWDPSRIRARRRELHISQFELARQLGWSQMRVSRTERGESQPAPDDLVILCRILKLPSIGALYSFRPRLRVIRGGGCGRSIA